MYVGDAFNDGPALATSHISVALDALHIANGVHTSRSHIRDRQSLDPGVGAQQPQVVPARCAAGNAVVHQHPPEYAVNRLLEAKTIAPQAITVTATTSHRSVPRQTIGIPRRRREN